MVDSAVEVVDRRALPVSGPPGAMSRGRQTSEKVVGAGFAMLRCVCRGVTSERGHRLWQTQSRRGRWVLAAVRVALLPLWLVCR